MRQFAYQATGNISPMQAVIGGIAAQEVMKVSLLLIWLTCGSLICQFVFLVLIINPAVISLSLLHFSLSFSLFSSRIILTYFAYCFYRAHWLFLLFLNSVCLPCICSDEQILVFTLCSLNLNINVHLLSDQNQIYARWDFVTNQKWSVKWSMLDWYISSTDINIQYDNRSTLIYWDDL